MAEHTAGKDVTALALMFFDPTGGINKLLKKVLGKLKKVAGVVTDKVNDNLKKVILRMEKGKGPEFKRDLDTNPELKKLFDESSDPDALSKTFNDVKGLDIDETFKKNPDIVKTVDDARKEGLDGLDPLEDAIQTTGKSKPTKEEVLALFKRGNDFNRKAAKEQWYPFNEVHLSNGKRLDSYDVVKGKIVSRKATDLSKIQKSTFEKYLNELKQKYLPGTKIRSDKYPSLDGQQLNGQQILEIPESNRSFDKLQEYIDLAAEYDIEISFRSE